jgi:hypothetical protein
MVPVTPVQGATLIAVRNLGPLASLVSARGDARHRKQIELIYSFVLGWGGGLSESIVVPQSHVYRLPGHIPLELGGE